jgi:hypothetical protein
MAEMPDELQIQMENNDKITVVTVYWTRRP